MTDTHLYVRPAATICGSLPPCPADDASATPHRSDGIAPPKCVTGGADLQYGRVFLNSATLRSLRQSRLLSQQDLADDCWRRNIRVSIATIKRAESGRAVRYRIARELARCFEVPVINIIRA